MVEFIERMRQFASERRLCVTLHARKEMDADSVGIEALAQALASATAEIIEDYPEDQRGHSHLILAWLEGEEAVHVCCALHESELVIITVYRPDTQEWTQDMKGRL